MRNVPVVYIPYFTLYIHHVHPVRIGPALKVSPCPAFSEALLSNHPCALPKGSASVMCDALGRSTVAFKGSAQCTPIVHLQILAIYGFHNVHVAYSVQLLQCFSAEWRTHPLLRNGKRLGRSVIRHEGWNLLLVKTCHNKTSHACKIISL